MNIDKVLVIASAIIVKNSKVLLLKRGGTKTFQNHWQLPEGKLEQGEKPIDALKRELKEEINQTIKKAELTAVSCSPLEAKGIKYLACRLIFKTILKSYKIRLSEEHSDYGWFKTEDLNSLPLLPGTKEAISR